MKILDWSDSSPDAFLGESEKHPEVVLSQVIQYLRRGDLIDDEGVRQHCRICSMRLGNQERTDGRVIWPDQTEHYIIAHHVWAPEHEALASKVIYGSESQMSDMNRMSDEDTDLELGSTDFDISWLQDDDPDGEEQMIQPDMTIPERFRKALQGAQRHFQGKGGVRTVSGPPVGSELGIHFVVEDDRVAEQIPPRIFGFPTQVHVHPSPSPMQEEAYGHHHAFHPQGMAYGALPGPVQEKFGAGMAQQISSAYPKAAHIAPQIVQVANHIGAHPFDLANQIGFESAWTFAPNIQYGQAVGAPFHPKLATGLIQFMPTTAKQLGTTTQALYTMSAPQQMAYVQRYFDMVRKGRPLDNPYKLAMAVFYRDAIDWNPNRRFTVESKVTQRNPGIYTPNDYMSKLLGSRHRKLPSSSGTEPSAAEASSANGEPGVLSQLSSWLGSFFDSGTGTGTGPDAPSVPQSSVSQSSTSQWSMGQGLKLRLAHNGKTFGPGKVPAGQYELQQNNGSSWITMGSVQLSPGESYQAYVDGGRIKWSGI